MKYFLYKYHAVRGEGDKVDEFTYVQVFLMRFFVVIGKLKYSPFNFDFIRQ